MSMNMLKSYKLLNLNLDDNYVVWSTRLQLDNVTWFEKEFL